MQPLVNKGIEPICGWQWVYQHLHDLDGWIPTIELRTPGLSLKMQVKDLSVLKRIIEISKTAP